MMDWFALYCLAIPIVFLVACIPILVDCAKIIRECNARLKEIRGDRLPPCG